MTQNSEFQSQRLLYDEFCITKVKISWIPATNVVLSTAISSSQSTSNFLYTFVDRDGGSPVTTATNIPAKIEAYDSFKKHSANRGWSRTITCKKMWIDCSVPGIDPRSESGLAQPFTNAGLFQVLGIYGTMLPYAIGSQIGTVRQEWSVQFRGKKPVSYSVLPDGVSVVMTPLSAFGNELIALNAPGELAPPLFDNYVDVSGDTIVVISNTNGHHAVTVENAD